MLGQAKFFVSFGAHLILTPKHGLLQSAEGCDDEEIQRQGAENRPAGTSSQTEQAISCVCTLSFHKTNGTSGQKGKGYTGTHRSPLIRKNLTVGGYASQLVLKNKCMIFNHSVNCALLGNS